MSHFSTTEHQALSDVQLTDAERQKAAEHIAFADHHTFTSADLQRLADRYANFAAGPKLLITTEKDAARLSSSIAGSPLNGLPIGVIGMRTVILNGPERFADLIRHHVSTHRTHRRSP